MQPPSERVSGPTGRSPIVLTCEHASDHLPVPWGDDAWLQPLHWAVDLGIADFTRALAQRLDARGTLAGFSRLWIDANRPLYSTTLFRDVADGRPVHLNVDLPDHERLARILACWRPFHDAVDAMIAEHPARLLLSMHSFTPIYEGNVREVEIGVLFDDEDARAARLAELLEPSGYCVRLNEPYSGKGGMMYSCYDHATRHGLVGIELELRQDLLADDAHHARLLDAVATAVQALVEEETP
jgi:predicted N-formylglutamate amidohydrolase